MAKAFWKGAISFGMVTIPVKMYVAAASHGISFHLLHKKCLTRPKQVLHCDEDKEYFGIKDTVRAYEYSKGRYAVLKDSDFDKVRVKTTHLIDITGFINEGEIDPSYFYGTHYLEPEKLALKPYCLLRETLRKAERVGIAKISFQKREHLACLRPVGDILVLHTVHYQNEILPTSKIDIPKVDITAAELKVAQSLVDVMTTTFHPDTYQDNYSIALERIIAAKIQGAEIKAPPEPEVTEIRDLMAALRASITAASKEVAAVKR
jgi:DNA end-binding protein Ku